MAVFFTKNNDLILFHFNMKKLNMLNFLHIKKTSFEVVRHHCFVLFWRQRDLHTCACFLLHIYVNICLNNLVQQNLKIVCEYWKK